jgi:hypothetical protein
VEQNEEVVVPVEDVMSVILEGQVQAHEVEV